MARRKLHNGQHLQTKYQALIEQQKGKTNLGAAKLFGVSTRAFSTWKNELFFAKKFDIKTFYAWLVG